MENIGDSFAPSEQYAKSFGEKSHILKRDAGKWLASLRQQAGLSQRELARATHCDFYTFISQIENGKGKIPPSKYFVWAQALNVEPRLFVRTLLSYYDPITYDILFGTQPNDGTQT